MTVPIELIVALLIIFAGAIGILWRHLHSRISGEHSARKKLEEGTIKEIGKDVTTLQIDVKQLETKQCQSESDIKQLTDNVKQLTKDVSDVNKMILLNNEKMKGTVEKYEHIQTSLDELLNIQRNNKGGNRG